MSQSFDAQGARAGRIALPLAILAFALSAATLALVCFRVDGGMFGRRYDANRYGSKTTTGSIGGYRFSYPADWRMDMYGDMSASFFGKDGAKIAAFTCPIPGAGYQGWDITKTQRSFDTDGKPPSIELWYGTPESAGTKGFLHKILMSDTVRPERYQDCEMSSISTDPAMRQIYADMHASMRF
jgi:hypothetical protein